MKIAILSDLHLGYERFAEDAYKQAEEALMSAVELADAVLIPGDIFDTRNPDVEVLSQGFTLFRNASNGKKWSAKVIEYSGRKRIYTSIPIIAISGTHERKSKDADNAVDLLGLAGLLVNASEAKVTIDNGGERVVVWAFGGVAEEKVKDTIKELAPKPEQGAFNVFMFHQSIYELLPFDDRFIRYDELPDGFDLYVNGHIHSNVEHKVHGKPFLIPGSTVLTQLKEGEQGSKGFYIFDTAENAYTFMEIKSRRFKIMKIDVDGKDGKEILRHAESEIERMCGEGTSAPIIRIMLIGKKTAGASSGINIQLHEMASRYKDRAIIEIDNGRLNGEEMKMHAEALRQELLENSSVKDLGMALFVEKLKQKGYSLDISPTELFDMLSHDGKEKAVPKVFEALFEQQ